jgi:hypothetical protein
MSDMENHVKRWKRALLDAQGKADREPNPEIKAAHLSMVESYTRLIASDTTIASLEHFMRKEIEDDPE